MIPSFKHLGQILDELLEEKEEIMNEAYPGNSITSSTIDGPQESCDPELAIPDRDIMNGANDERTDPLFNHRIGFIPFAYHKIPRRALAKVAAVMRCGERKGRLDEWAEVPVYEHINHAISHIMAFWCGDRSHHHLANAACRILMALDLEEEEPLPRPEYNPVRPPPAPGVPHPTEY